MDMKKKLLSFILVFCTVVFVSAQEVVAKVPGQGEVIPNSHWSVSLKAGGSYFRTGGMQYNYALPFFTRSRLDFTSVVGGTVEYTFTPIFGLGLDLTYTGYSRWNDLNEDRVRDNYLTGNTKDLALFGSFNLSNLFTPQRTGFWEKLSLYANVGTGIAFYKYDVAGHVASPSSFLALGGLNLEYNISKSFAIGGELQYRYYAKDDMGYYANYQPTGFCDAALVTLSLRYKMNATGAKKHVRNINALEYVPLDGDNDGVSDLKDKCPGTPAGVQVDSVGCPVDTDVDGVADYLDKCLGTQAGVSVDSVGCPVDTDADGVADYLDKCPATPAGVKVNVQGCPIDTDGDGIPDYLDKCPTVAGVAANHGCPAEVAALPPFSEMGVSNFRIGSAEIKPSFIPVLNNLVDYLKANETAVVDLQGNTDSTGSDELNQRLSVKRAKSCAGYLIKKGVPSNKITTQGFGEKKPITTNSTVEGRAKNRRCDFVISRK
jgi:opacity protein-like surface antigen